MTRKLSYIIPLLISLALTSKVNFDYNSVPSRRTIGMVCSVQDQDEGSLIMIKHGGTVKITLTSDCVIKSNDSRLEISCIQAGDRVMLNVSLTRPDSSDMGTWTCSDGESNDTVTFADFIGDIYWDYHHMEMTFNCYVHQECNFPIRFMLPETNVTTIDGKIILRQAEHGIITEDKWRGRIIINDSGKYLHVMIPDVDISDAGIYCLRNIRFKGRFGGFIIAITDYPKQPVIILRRNVTMSKGGLYELYCASESKSHPVFTRKQLSFTWRINGHNLSDFQPCFSLNGPILTLCTDACGLSENDNISISCTANEDGLNSNESEPFTVSASRVTSARSARDTDNMDRRTERATWILAGACLGSFMIGILFCSSLKALVKTRCAVCRKEHRDKERSIDIIDDTLYVNTFMLIHANPETELTSGNTDDKPHINSIIADTHQANEGEIRQYEALAHGSVEDHSKQYDVVQSTRSGHHSKEDTYEDI
ncbi:hypothetical protein ACJMK2_030408 [Sinanodonta woodiana]|uniref:Ig-like domain-containing protein n=1 Tax=Sinanodonta woodiana TaxID=1069815 RepID=A0ABD3XH11_SINWO